MTERYIVMIMPKRNDPDEILTVSQIAKEWQVSDRTIQRYIATGRLKATRLPSGISRVRRSDAEKALNPPHLTPSRRGRPPARKCSCSKTPVTREDIRAIMREELHAPGGGNTST